MGQLLRMLLVMVAVFAASFVVATGVYWGNYENARKDLFRAGIDLPSSDEMASWFEPERSENQPTCRMRRTCCPNRR